MKSSKTPFASPDKMEIHHMLTLSTAHIDQKTCDLLTSAAENPSIVGIPVYEKKSYGWFIPVSSHMPKRSTRPLTNCIVAALAAKCDWLCLDANGPIIPDIPTYE